MERLTNHFDYCKMIDCKFYDPELFKQGKCKFFDIGIQHCHEKRMNDKLREYEDAEEQGLLIRVPSRKVWESSGDAVYYIYDYEIVECINCGISVDCEGNIWIALACDEDIFPYRTPIPEIDTSFEDWCKNSTDVKIEEWGKTVFLTREEAEVALERMK